MKTHINVLFFISIWGFLLACTKAADPGSTVIVDPVVDVDYSDTSLRLQDVAPFPVGASVSFNHLSNDPKLAAILYANFNELVFNSELKHGALVKGDGTFDFTTADAFVGLAKDMDIYGHVLAWHRHQGTSYLNTLVGNLEQQELLLDPGFEKSTTVGSPYWFALNSGDPRGSATIALTTQASEVNSGTSALKVVNPTAYGTSDWRVQVASNNFQTVPGQKYVIRYTAKSMSGSGTIMVSVQAMDGSGVTHYPGGDKTITGEWQTITLSFTPTKENYRIVFNMGKKADTYLVDDVSVYSEEAAPDYAAIYTRLDEALHTFIRTTVGRYKDKIRKWEVVNEMFTDAGEIRSNSNSLAPIVDGQKEYGYFIWSEFLKRDYGYLAFRYAEEADPTAELYINDYGLEYSDKKLDSLIAYVHEIRRRGAKVDGIGTQMHIDIYLSQTRIDKMFQKLASTGLKVRVSELDIRITNSSTPIIPTEAMFEKQREQYERVVSSYMKFVPPKQRAGIAVWGIVDHYNWQYNEGSDYPNLFSTDYKKKPAYGGFLMGLSGREINQ